jgi:hypothetical protein
MKKHGRTRWRCWSPCCCSPCARDPPRPEDESKGYHLSPSSNRGCWLDRVGRVYARWGHWARSHRGRWVQVREKKKGLLG